MKSISKLDIDVLVKYGNRKKPGRVSFFVDTETERVYPVPVNVEHVDYAAKLKKEHKVCYEKLVPTHIDTNGIEVIGVSTGYSGLEMKLGVRHAPEDLAKAHSIIWDIVNKGRIPIGKMKENYISVKYAKKD